MRTSANGRRQKALLKSLVSWGLLAFTPIVMADDIDDFVKAEMTRLQIPAVAFAIVKNGQVVRREAIGVADVAAKREAKVDDLYEIGSLTKQFTSMGVMFLVEGGRVNLDDSVSKYLHDAPAKWSAVKIRNLLVQDSGLPEYVTLPGVGLLDSFTRTQFMDAVGKLPVDFQPGAAWAYSNTNYALLGWLIEDVTKEPYTKFIEENIIRPIGMNHTVFAEKGVTVDGLARGYVMRRRMRMPSPAGAASIKADGALISNLADMVKWDAALTSLRLLTRKSYQTIWTRAVLNSGRSHAYGMGWYLNQPGTHGYMGHSGTSAGYSAGISRFPGPRLTVILLANMYGVGGEAMTKKIAVLFDPTLDNAPFAAVPDPDPQRTERVKAAIQAISTNNPDDPLLDPEYAVPMKTRRTRMASFGTWGQIKQVDGIVFGGARQQGADTFLTYRVSSGPRNFIVSVLWTTQGKLAQATITLEEPTKPAPAVGKG